MLKAGQWIVNGKVKGSMLGVTGTGKEQLAVEFATDDPGVPGITKYLFFTEAAMEMTTKALVALGWKPEDHDYDITKLDGTDVLVGREATLVLENEDYEGKTRAKVVFINSPGGGGVKERMTPEGATSFREKARALLRMERAKDGAAPSPAKTEEKRIEESLKKMPF